MIIKKIEIKEGFFTKTFNFDEGVNVVYSKKNSVGKTTLLRFILFGLGYQIPSTKKINFYNYTIEVILLINTKELKLVRYKDVIELVFPEMDNRFFTLPYEVNDLHKIIFETDNEQLLINLLGSYYLDQDKGWTLLNRGTVIGKNKFNIEQLIRALAKRDTSKLEKQLDTVELELNKYKKMYSIVEYQKEIKEENNEVIYEAVNEEIEQKINILMFDKNTLLSELSELNSVISNNKKFINYIDQMKLTITYKDYIDIPVNRETISNYNDIKELTLVRKKLLLGQLKKVENEISNLKETISHEEKLLNTKSLINNFNEKIMNINIDMQSVDNVIKLLEQQRKDIKDNIKVQTSYNNNIINDIYLDAKKYAEKLDIETYFDLKQDYIFTSDLKSLSGTILHMMVFAFKLAYINAIRKYSNIVLPIVIDSPNGREVLEEHIDKMYKILVNDFSSHQIIIATIHPFKGEHLGINIKESVLES